jgi:hypothetical protein
VLTTSNADSASPNFVVQDLWINDTYYTIDSGSLYFTKSLEEIIAQAFPGYEEAIEWLDQFTNAQIYYYMHIVFDRFVPNTSEETNRLALAQSTSYAIMDYFNQYTFAQVSANMISEICYTETVTFWSTLISLPLIYLGSWTVKGTEQFLKAAGQGVVEKTLSNLIKSIAVEIVKGGIKTIFSPKALLGVLMSPIIEVFQEIIQDGLIEALSENIIDLIGGTEELEFWVSSIGTSMREVGGALGQLTLGRETSLRNALSVLISRNKGKVSTEVKEEVANIATQNNAMAEQFESDKKLWIRLLKNDMVRGLFMLAPSFLGGLNFLALLGSAKMLEGTLHFDSKLYSDIKAQRHAQSADRIPMGSEFSPDTIFTTRLQEEHKQSSELNTIKEEIANKLQEQQDSNKEGPPTVSFTSRQNFNPRNIREELATAFHKTRMVSWTTQLSQDYRFKSRKEQFEFISKNAGTIEFQGEIEKVKEQVREALEDFPTLLRFVDYTGEIVYDPKHIAFGIRLGPRADIRIASDLIFREEYPPSLSTEEYVNELQRSFDVDSSFQPFLIKNGKIYLMPVNSRTILGNWLKEVGHSIYDKICLVPTYATATEILMEYIHGIENKINDEIEKRINFQRPCRDFLTETEIEILYDFYSTMDENLYEKVEGVDRSPYSVHFKFLFDELFTILSKNSIIVDYDHNALSSFIFPSGSSSSYSKKLSKMKNGKSFDIPESSLDDIYLNIWYKIKYSEISESKKKSIISRLDTLFDLQYSLYGHNRPNSLYRDVRKYYLQLVKIAFKNRLIGNSFNQDRFNSEFHIDPSFTKYHDADFKPLLDTYNVELRNEMIKKFRTSGLADLVLDIGRIIDDLVSAITISYLNKDILEDYPDNWIKKELLVDIINCPYTDVLKKVDTKNHLDFILFNHPSYKGSSSTYIGDVYFDKENFKSLAMIDSLWHRVSTLTVKDFNIIGLGDDINENSLERLKDYVDVVINKYIEKEGINNYEWLDYSYATKELRDLQLEVIRLLWRAAASHEDNFFITYSKAFESLLDNDNQRFYNQHITRPYMMNKLTVLRLIAKLDQWIQEDSKNMFIPASVSYSAIVNLRVDYNLFGSEKISNYIAAITKLNEYLILREENIEEWGSRQQDIISWFDKLFKPSSKIGYAYGWDKDPLYRAWAVCMGIFDVFGTDLISGDSISQAAFDVDEILRYSLHHLDTSLTMSLALKDHIITYEQYHPYPIETMSKEDLESIRIGLRELFENGINKDPRNIETYPESSVKQWINIRDFRQIFPDGRLFSIRYRGEDHEVSLYHLWNNVFNSESFESKLRSINEKIQVFRDALERGINPYVAFCNTFYATISSRFLDNAKTFAHYFWVLGSKRGFRLHTAGDLASIRDIFLMKKIFELG